MQDITVSAYRGFSRVEGETTLSILMDNIRSGTYFRLVQRVEEQQRIGNLARANDIKKQLPFFTLTANYSCARQPYSLVRYNPVVTIDVDDLADGQVEPVRHTLEACPDVVASFLTPKRHGFKIFLYLRTDYAGRLRRLALSLPVLGYHELEEHHARMYEACRLYVEELLGVPVDTSGKDISRGFFASFDPQAYFNPELMHEIELPTARLLVPERPAAPSGSAASSGRSAAFGSASFGSAASSGRSAASGSASAPFGSAASSGRSAAASGSDASPFGSAVASGQSAAASGSASAPFGSDASSGQSAAASGSDASPFGSAVASGQSAAASGSASSPFGSAASSGRSAAPSGSDASHFGSAAASGQSAAASGSDASHFSSAAASGRSAAASGSASAPFGSAAASGQSAAASGSDAAPFGSAASSEQSAASGTPASEFPDIAPWQEMEYKKALSTTRRSEKFRPGNRDNFLFVLGNRCFRKGVDEAVAMALAERDFRQPDLDVSIAIRNAYRYVSKTQEAAKADKTPVVKRVLDFLSAHYKFRRNTVLDRIEINGGDGFRPLRTQDLNSVFVGLLTEGVNCSLPALRAIIDSDHVKNYDPFADYLRALPAWDGTTDYIAALAGTVRTEDPDFWHDSFRRWLVGMVACALYPQKVNQLVLLLFGGQGKGKTTWITRLLPPEWREYCHTGMINPDNRDDMLLLSTRLLINLDEFQGVRASDLAGFKRIVTQDVIVQRKVYDTQAFSFVRHASFIASTNKRQCLQDIDGNRRFLPSSVLSLDYRTPVNYRGVYSQALALLDSGFRYWYEGDEIDGLNDHNEHHRLKDPVEEHLFVYFRKALPEDYIDVRWMPASSLLARISMFGRVQVTRQTQQELVQALEKHDFCTRINGQGSTEYKVVEFQAADVEENFKR